MMLRALKFHAVISRATAEGEGKSTKNGRILDPPLMTFKPILALPVVYYC